MFSNQTDHRGKRKWAKVTVAIMLSVAAVWQCIGAWTDSQTTDEAVHLAAGYSYWQTNDHRLNPEHPPLFKLVASAPLLLVPQLWFSTADPSWVTPEQWGLGYGFLYYSRSDPAAAQWILFLGRLVPIGLTLLLGWVLWWWAKRIWGEWAGVLAVGLFLFDPTVLGHGHLVTNDIAVALAIVVTIIFVERFVTQPSWSRLSWAVGFFALAQTTKFSAIILWLIVPITLLVRTGYGKLLIPWRWTLRFLVGLVLLTPAVIFTVYGFEIVQFDADPAIGRALDQAVTGTVEPNEPPITRWLVEYGRPDSPVGKVLETVRDWPIPAYSYFRGLIETSNHNFFGHTAFLFGQVRERGWWYYFPVALAVKMPLVTMAALLAAAGLAIRQGVQRRRWWVPENFWFVAWPPVVYLVWSLTSHINIGVRHVIPVMIFLFLWAASLISHLRTELQQRTVAIGIVSLLALTSLLAWPHTLGYFNALAGGSKNGPNLLHDSNYDWNQDTWRLRAYIQRHGLERYGLAIPGGRAGLFFPNAGNVPNDAQIDGGLKPQGTFFISAMALFDRDNDFHWLWSYEPTAIVGTTVYRFDFR